MAEVSDSKENVSLNESAWHSHCDCVKRIYSK